MPSDAELLKHLYDRFNARDMEAVLATMHEDVVWANGMERGHVGFLDVYGPRPIAIDFGELGSRSQLLTYIRLRYAA